MEKANHIKWKCTSDGGHGVANAWEEEKNEGRGWPSSGVGEQRARASEMAKREGTKRGARELHCSTRPWITASTISRFGRAILFVRSSGVQVIGSFTKERNGTCTVRSLASGA